MPASQQAADSTPTPDAGPQPSGPHPALRRLDRFIGTWQMSGRTLDSATDNVTARTTYEWLPGGHFLLQRFEADFVGLDIRSFEVIGYDPATDSFRWAVYSNMAPTSLAYRWQVRGDELTITTEELGPTFRGRWSADGTSFSGGWRPNPVQPAPEDAFARVDRRRAVARALPGPPS